MINVTRSSMPEFSEYCEEIKDIWESRWLTNNGVKHRELESKLCDYLKSKGKTLSEIFEIVINEVAYPIGVPVNVQKFEFDNIPDIETLIAAILNIYKFCRDYMDMCTYSMNFENITVNYDKKTKVLSAVCK